ncbi:2-keto-4-pentenoate hydratase [Microlunatus aurantiacus]|uniref:2-keto-4-pentenoate hydratase n=1 Tax=Microlunatus aurantiacus TaxID=446786 RepID=A0ABP7D7A6_9ACTN
MNGSETPGRIAATLVAARQAGRALDGFPGETPADMTAAYRIQDAAIARWPDTVAGWKIGFIAADRRSVGESDRLVGPIWSRGLLAGDADGAAAAGSRVEAEGPVVEAGIFGDGFAAVEAEFVVRLDEDVPVRSEAWTAEEAARLAQQLRVGIEVASSPIPDINALGPTVIAADFGNNNGLLVGPELDDPDGAVLRCFVDDELLGEGTSANLPGGLHQGLATALTVLTARGHTVPAGTLFATGAITGIHPIRPGQRCRVEVRGGPSLELRTVDVRSTLG